MIFEKNLIEDQLEKNKLFKSEQKNIFFVKSRFTFFERCKNAFLHQMHFCKIFL